MDGKKDAQKAKGGFARAGKLSPDQRKEIAQKAATTRWEIEKDLIKATHGSPDHPLRIGDIEIPCYVLEDGKRVLVQGDMLTALDMKQGTAGRGEGDRIVKFLSTKAIKPFANRYLGDVIIKPIKFKTPSGGTAHGYEATLLTDICDAVLEARKENKLHYQQEHIAKKCEILVRSFAKVGIIALVDEATGYQEVRARDALQAYLDRVLRKELAAWVKRFPDDFFRQIYRLKKWKWSGSNRRPSVVGKYIADIVYSRLGPGILDELERLNPKVEKRRKAAHHQWLTEDTGHPALSQHLYAVTGLMRMSDSWQDFMKLLDKGYPKKNNKQLEFFFA